LLLQISEEAIRGGRLIVSLDSVATNPAAMAVARATDAVLLCVYLGRTELAAAKHLIKMIGPERIIGCVTVKPQ
jgi:hypothetical protein